MKSQQYKAKLLDFACLLHAHIPVVFGWKIKNKTKQNKKDNIINRENKYLYKTNPEAMGE